MEIFYHIWVIVQCVFEVFSSYLRIAVAVLKLHAGRATTTPNVELGAHSLEKNAVAFKICINQKELA